MAYRYRATADGVLSDPYRHITKGQEVISKEPIKASWLVPVEKFGADKPLPIMPFMNAAGSRVEQIKVPPAAVGSAYQHQMETLTAIERKQDGKEPIKKDEPKKADEPKKGTGNQEVI